MLTGTRMYCCISSLSNNEIKTGNMKRIICIASLLYGLSAQAQTPAEAVGINTETPRGVLHIDGGATDSQPADDVLIDSGGRLGAGLTAPEAKVDLSAAA